MTGSRTEGVGGDREIEVKGSSTVTIGGDSDESVEGDRSVAVSGSAITQISGLDYRAVGGSQAVSVSGDLQQIVDGECALYHGGLSVTVSGATAIQGSGDVQLESGSAMKIGAPNVYLSGDSTIHLRAYTKIVLEVASSDDDDKDGDSQKIEITREGIYITAGGTTKKLTGDKVSFNC